MRLHSIWQLKIYRTESPLTQTKSQNAAPVLVQQRNFRFSLLRSEHLLKKGFETPIGFDPVSGVPPPRWNLLQRCYKIDNFDGFRFPAATLRQVNRRYGARAGEPIASRG